MSQRHSQRRGWQPSLAGDLSLETVAGPAHASPSSLGFARPPAGFVGPIFLATRPAEGLSTCSCNRGGRHCYKLLAPETPVPPTSLTRRRRCRRRRALDMWPGSPTRASARGGFRAYGVLLPAATVIKRWSFRRRFLAPGCRRWPGKAYVSGHRPEKNLLLVTRGFFAKSGVWPARRGRSAETLQGTGRGNGEVASRSRLVAGARDGARLPGWWVGSLRCRLTARTGRRCPALAGGRSERSAGPGGRL